MRGANDNEITERSSERRKSKETSKKAREDNNKIDSLRKWEKERLNKKNKQLIILQYLKFD